MYMLRRLIPTLFALTIAASAAFCQEVEATKFYKLEFVVKEVEGTKVVNSRAYSTVTSVGDKSTIRSESRVPKKVESSANQFQQFNIGIGIDAHVIRELENRLSLNVMVDLSTLAGDESGSPVPILRQNKWNSTLVVPFKKPITVFTSDVPDSKRQVQVEVTAIPFP